MNSFCTRCGAAIASDLRFCTACGTVREAEPTGSAASAPSDAKSKRRRTWPWWALAVIAAFLIGLLLGRGPAAKPQLPCGAGNVEISPGGKPVKGPGGPIKLGGPGTGDAPPVAGNGTSKISHRSGNEGDGRNDDAEDPAAGKSPEGNLGDNGSVPASNSQSSDQLRSDLLKYAQGKGGPNGDGHIAEAKAAPQGKSYSTNDFTYDKTGLPRYPDSVSAVVSSVTYGPDGRTDTFSTGAGIVTSSAFDTVVAWYREHLPGWHDTTIADMGELSSQLSVQAISNMLGAAANDAPDAGAASASASAPADRLRIALFSPPPGTQKSGVMVVERGDGPVEALLQAKVAPGAP